MHSNSITVLTIIVYNNNVKISIAISINSYPTVYIKLIHNEGLVQSLFPGTHPASPLNRFYACIVLFLLSLILSVPSLLLYFSELQTLKIKVIHIFI